MILYSTPSSYYSMIARLALQESGMSFVIKPMDIHFAKDQLSPWYMAINPAMTVPSLIDGERAWLDSRAILQVAASFADNQWYDSDSSLQPHINELVDAHYTINIELLTFSKAMSRFFLLRKMVPHVLQGIIRKLEKELPGSKNPTATQAKITLNQHRLAYFTEGNLADKLASQRETVVTYIHKLPLANPLLFGEKISSADIVTAILFSRLMMIGEERIFSPFNEWFKTMQERPAFKRADIWVKFHPLRLLLRR